MGPVQSMRSWNPESPPARLLPSTGATGRQMGERGGAREVKMTATGLPDLLMMPQRFPPDHWKHFFLGQTSVHMRANRKEARSWG